MYIFFDTETESLPKDYKGKMSDVENWPRITPSAWAKYDANRNLVSYACHLIKPDGWSIPKERFFIDNNMSTERCEAEGLPISGVLTDFINAMTDCEYMIAHNLAFDYPIVGAEMIRASLRAQLFDINVAFSR